MKKIFVVLVCSFICATSLSQGNVYIAVRINDNVDKNMHQVIEDIFQEQLTSVGYQVRVSRDFGDFEEERERELRYQNSGAVSINDAIAPGNEMPVEQLCVISVEKIGSIYYFRAKVYNLETKMIYRTAYYPGAKDEYIEDLTDIRTLQSVAAKLVAKLGYNEQDANALAMQIKEKRDCEIMKRKRHVNATALAYSIIPGLGLMMKGHKTEGTIYMIGDIALIGAGVGMIAYADTQQKIMNDHSTGIDQYKNATNNYNMSKTIAYCCFGTAAALYVVNLVRSYVAEPKQKARLQWAFVPSVSPSMYGEPNMSMNLALCYKF